MPPDEAGLALDAQGGGLAAGDEGGGGEQRGPEEQQLGVGGEGRGASARGGCRAAGSGWGGAPG